jgi:hypothetical protein
MAHSSAHGLRSARKHVVWDRQPRTTHEAAYPGPVVGHIRLGMKPDNRQRHLQAGNRKAPIEDTDGVQQPGASGSVQISEGLPRTGIIIHSWRREQR